MIPFKITHWIFSNTLKEVDIPPSTISHWLFYVLKYARKNKVFWIWKLNLNFAGQNYLFLELLMKILGAKDFIQWICKNESTEQI